MSFQLLKQPPSHPHLMKLDLRILSVNDINIQAVISARNPGDALDISLLYSLKPINSLVNVILQIASVFAL